ncbi:hypothetical protein [Rhodococcus sp. NPDC049939]|uniref:hypothetical protein n=1 Tax=Rhodococcus sp. NPDC049939 TaxID=3155511 RepID=UPI0033D53E77
MSSTRRRISVLIAVPTMALAITGTAVGVASAAGVNSDSAYQAQTQTVSMQVSNDLASPFIVPAKHYGGHGHFKNRGHRGYGGGFFGGFQNNQY